MYLTLNELLGNENITTTERLEALRQLVTTGHTHAHFGVFGHFLFTLNKED